MRNGLAASGGPESYESASEEEVDEKNDENGLFLLLSLSPPK